MELTKVELDCPARFTPKQYAKQWIKNNGNGETLLLKVNNAQNIARNHINAINREYYYLFKDGKLILGHLPGMDRLFTENTFEHMIFRAKFKKFRPKRLQKILEVRDLIFNSKKEGE